MPNGNHDFDLASVALWFAPLGPTIRDFSERRNLHIDKYYHDSPCWSLRFAHPAGGVGSIDVLMSAPDQIGIGAHWHVDDEIRAERSLHWRPFLKIAKDANALAAVLGKELDALLSTPLGSWTQVSGLSTGADLPEGAVLLRPTYPTPRS